MSEVWEIRIERRESITGPVIAASTSMMTVEEDEASRGKTIHFLVDQMLDSIIRGLRMYEVGEE